MHKTASLFSTTIPTPLGDMLAIADDSALYTLEFANNPKLFPHKNRSIITKTNAVLELLKQELTGYFAGTGMHFTVPVHLQGTDFQQQTWQHLGRIPYGTTISYAQLAQAVNNPTAYRAVANANGANRCALIIPCHRVISSTGACGGYRYTPERKLWLLQHEQNILMRSTASTIL